MTVDRPHFAYPFGRGPAGRYITVPGALLNPSFEAGTTNWAGSAPEGGTLTFTVGAGPGAHAGTKVAILTATSAGITRMCVYEGTGSFTPIEAGKVLKVSAWVRSAAVSRAAYIVATFYDAALVPTASAIQSLSVPTSTSAWTTVTLTTETAPANTVSVGLQIFIQSPGNGEVHYVDDLSMSILTPMSRKISVVEQGTDQHVLNQIYAVVVTPEGHRLDQPEFGWPWPEFRMLPLDLEPLERSIHEFVPDADFDVNEWASTASQAIRHVRISETAGD